MLSAIFRLFNGRNGKDFLKGKRNFLLEKTFLYINFLSHFLHVKMFSKGKARLKRGKRELFRDSG